MMEFPCPGCGAELQWKPGQSAMECPYCSHQIEDPNPDADASSIQEYRLDEAADKAPKGYGTETEELLCKACGAAHSVAADVEVTQCPFCGSNQVNESVAEGVIRPESVLAFEVEVNDARRKFREWISSLWFRPSSLKSDAQLHSIAGVYVPAWTFDAEARSRWTAEAGHYYYEEVSKIVDGEEKTVKERKTRWEPAAGQHAGSYDDHLVQASGGLDQAALKGLLPFAMEKLKPYDTRYLAGFRAERYAIDLDGAWGTAQKELGNKEKSECRKLVPGDTQRNLKVKTEFADVTFKHTLLPIYIAAYRYNDEVYRYLVNGQSGAAHGDAPYSYWKIGFFVLFIIGMIFMCFGGLSVCGGTGAALSR